MKKPLGIQGQMMYPDTLTVEVKNKRQIDTPKDLGNLDLMRVKFEQIRKIE